MIYILFVYEFRWNEWNIDHVAKHGIHPTQAEYVVNHPFRGYPEARRNKKYLVRGQDFAGFYLQVIFVFDEPGVVYVIHARPLNEQEKRRLRHRRRS